MEIKFNTNKKKAPTSKKLTWGVFLVWFISIILSYVMSFYKVETGYLVTATTASLGIVLSGYFSKSYFENKEKYKNKQEDTNDTTELGC